uniref:Uncharacterized protein n=1 Tax=Ciona savignyi TaxID=51511 RepID=H2Z9U6_CIOSA
MGGFIAVYLLPQFLPDWSVVREETHANKNSTTDFIKVNESPNLKYWNLPCFFKRKQVFIWVHFGITLLFLYFQVSLQILFAYPALNHHNICSKPSQVQQTRKLRRKPTSVPLALANNANSAQSKPRDSTSNEISQLVKTLSSSSDDANKVSSSHGNFIKPDVEAQRQTKMANTRNNKSSSSLGETQSEESHSKRNDKARCASKINPKKLKKRKSMRSRARIRVYILRCFIVALFCCLSDLVAFGFSIYAQIASKYVGTNTTSGASTTEHPGKDNFHVSVTISLLTGLAYNGNMLINLICLVLCYENWKSIIFPCIPTWHCLKFY